METDQNQLRRPKCVLKEAQTVTPPVQHQKADYHQAPTFCSCPNFATKSSKAFHASAPSSCALQKASPKATRRRRTIASGIWLQLHSATRKGLSQSIHHKTGLAFICRWLKLTRNLGRLQRNKVIWGRARVLMICEAWDVRWMDAMWNSWRQVLGTICWNMICDAVCDFEKSD